MVHIVDVNFLDLAISSVLSCRSYLVFVIYVTFRWLLSINFHFHMYEINVREKRSGNQEWTIQRNWQHWVHKTQDVR